MSDLPQLAAPAQRALQSAGISRLKQLTEITEGELLQLHGMGKNAINTLREALSANGLSFSSEIKEKALELIETEKDVKYNSLPYK